jgi:hypothetical protein
LVAALGIAALAGAGVTGSQAVGLYSSSHAPKAAVERYFEALQSGDAKAALGLADKPQTSQWLTAQVLREQLKIASITNVSVSALSSSGTTAKVQARYRLQFRNGPKDVVDTVTLVKRGSLWRLDSPAGSVKIDAVGPGSDRVSLAGRPLTDQSVVMFPGALPVTTDSPFVVLDGHPSVPLARTNSTVRIEPHLSDEGRRKMAQAVDAALAVCLTAAQPDLHCPAPAASRVIPGTLRGTTTAKFSDGGASIDLSSSGKGIVAFGGLLDVTGTWKAWDFNNQIIPGKGKLRMNVVARASIDDLSTIVWGAS